MVQVHIDGKPMAFINSSKEISLTQAGNSLRREMKPRGMRGKFPESEC